MTVTRETTETRATWVLLVRRVLTAAGVVRDRGERRVRPERAAPREHREPTDSWDRWDLPRPARDYVDRRVPLDRRDLRDATATLVSTEPRGHQDRRVRLDPTELQEPRVSMARTERVCAA